MWPNLLTFANLTFGFSAILMISQGRVVTGSWFIVLAALMDGLDGAVARLVKSSSKFGGEIDSLADVVSFGVAPAVLVYFSLADKLGSIAFLLAVLPLLAGATRLARYNLLASSEHHSSTFSGMPIPCAALLIAGFNIYAHADPDGIRTIPIWLSLVPIVSVLMISPIPYRRFPVVQINGAKHPWIPVGVIISIAIALLVDFSRMLFPLMIIYLFTGPIEWMYEHSAKPRDLDENEVKERINRRKRRK